MIEIENDRDYRLGDTIAYAPPKPFKALSKEEMDVQLREMLIWNAGGPFPRSLEEPKIFITLTKKAASLEDMRDADFYVKSGDGFLYSTKTSK